MDKKELIDQIISLGMGDADFDYENNDPQKECEKILNEYVKDQNLRTLAEFENYKKRTNKQIKEVSERVKFETLSKFIEVLDDLEFLRDVVKDTKSEDIKTGFSLIDKKIFQFLDEVDIKEVPTDILFNEDLHEAITTMDEGSEKGTILKVVSKGYSINGKIIKYPKVIVQQ